MGYTLRTRTLYSLLLCPPRGRQTTGPLFDCAYRALARERREREARASVRCVVLVGGCRVPCIDNLRVECEVRFLSFVCVSVCGKLDLKLVTKPGFQS